MTASPQDLLAFLNQHAIANDTFEHPAVFTVEESKQLRGPIEGGHTKNLFVKDKKGRLFLIVALEETRIDLKRVHETMGGQGRVSFGSGELLEEVWGVKPGSVTPFGAVNDKDRRVTVVLDAEMMKLARLNFHPLINTMTTGISADGLLAFLRATGHEPIIAALPVPPAA